MQSATAEDVLMTKTSEEFPYVATTDHIGGSHTDDELEIEAYTVRVQPDPTAEPSELASVPIEIAFSASAGVFVYQMGVAAYLQEHFDLSNCHFSGCSGGSWAATLLASDTSVRQAWKVIQETQRKHITEAKWYSGYGRYATIVAETAKELWQDDPEVFTRVKDHHLTIAVTKFPSMRPEKHTSWESLQDLTMSIMASSLVPFAVSGRPCITHRGQWYIDGAFTNFKGINCEQYSTWADVSFHAAQTVLDTVRAGSNALAAYLLPESLSKSAASLIYRLFPVLTSPHDAISPKLLPTSTSTILEETNSPAVKRLIIKPWNWRSHAVTAFHLSVDIDTHQQRFDTGYEDAMHHHHELAEVLPPKKITMD